MLIGILFIAMSGGIFAEDVWNKENVEILIAVSYYNGCVHALKMDRITDTKHFKNPKVVSEKEFKRWDDNCMYLLKHDPDIKYLTNQQWNQIEKFTKILYEQEWKNRSNEIK